MTASTEPGAVDEGGAHGVEPVQMTGGNTGDTVPPVRDAALATDPGRLVVTVGADEMLLSDLVKAAETGEIERGRVQVLQITERFARAMASGEIEQTPENMARFLDLCTRLVVWMARPDGGKLPDLTEEADESAATADGERLSEYRAFQEAAATLIGQDDAMRSYMSRLVPEIVPVEQLTISPETLAGALQKVLLRFEATHAVVPPSPMVSVEVKITELRALLARQPTVLFEQLFEAAATRMDVIATFLALLELLRAGEARVLQKEAFGDISVRRRTQEADHER